MNRTGSSWRLFLLLAIIIIVSQCSPYTGRKILTFFFDGVPNNDTSQIVLADSAAADTDTTEISEGMDYQRVALRVVHYPYSERECETCHDPNSLGSMIQPEPGLCYQCHEDLGTLYNYLHGPVEGGYCTACHHPHQADEEKLLRFTGKELCFYCHIETDVIQNEMHQDLEEMTCTDCHNPHGGEDKYILN